jgi:hypothetical protein
VTDVWVAGDRVVEAGQVTTLDVTALCSRAHAWQQRIA